jgi:ABC-type phosphate transport system auxiliary subunit
MKRILTALLCLAIPGLLLLNAWQGYRYNTLTDDVAALEDRQNALLESNRDLIGQIAFEGSSARVGERAAALGLVTAADAATTRLLVDPSGKAGAAR